MLISLNLVRLKNGVFLPLGDRILPNYYHILTEAGRWRDVGNERYVSENDALALLGEDQSDL